MRKHISYLLILVLMLSCVTQVSFADDVVLQNVALNKYAYATSVFNEVYVPSKVNDGNYQSAFSIKNKPTAAELLYPRDAQGNQWITIDLGANYQISQMTAYSRPIVDSNTERMGWIYQVAASEDFSDAVTIGKKNLPGSPGEGYTVSLKKPIVGRYVRVSSDQYMVIAEIEVFGLLAPERQMGKYGDVEENGKLYDIVQIVSKLGIMEGISDEELGVSHIMTRAEAVELAARLQGSGELDYSDTGYTDVDYEHEKSGYIAWCKNNGVISDAERFRPDDFITGTEFVTMLLRMNGWNCLAETQNSGYPANILYAAQKTKLVKGVDVDLGTYLNRTQALLLTYNMLTSNIAMPEGVNEYGIVYENGVTYLEHAFGLSLCEGVVEQIGYTNLVEPVKTNASTILIDGVKYIDDSGNAPAYLGEMVYYLSGDDNRVVHMWRNTDIVTRQTIMCKDIVKSDVSSITYCKDGSEKTERTRLESPIYFIKNGVASGDFRLSNLKRTNGKLILIDNDNNGLIDVIKLYEPKVIVVDYIGVDGEHLSIGAQNGDSLDVKSFEKLIITRNGLPLSHEEIASGALVYAYVSDDKKYVELEVSFDRVSGTVESFSDDEVIIDGESYEFSDYYTVNAAVIDDIRVGSKMSFVLDENGLIVWAINDSITSGKETLAVILAVSNPKGFDTMKLRLFTENNEMVTLPCANYVKVDGVKKSTEQLVSLGVDYFIDRAVIYRLNSNGLITYLDTETYNSALENYDVMQRQTKWSLPEDSYRVASGFYSEENMILPVYEDFPVFTIPKDADTGNIITDLDLAHLFSYSKIDTLYPNRSETQGTFNFYGRIEDESPAFAVRFVSVSAQTELATLKNPNNYNTMVVDYVATTLINDDEVTYRICGTDAITGKKTNVFVSAGLDKVVDSYKVYITKRTGGTLDGVAFDKWNYIDSVSSTGLNAYSSSIGELKRGDILRYEHDGTYVTALERIYSVFDTSYSDYLGNIINTGDNYSKVYRAGYRAFIGEIVSIDNGIVKLSVGTEIPLESFAYNKTTVENVIVLGDNEIKTCEISFLPMYAIDGAKLFVVTRSGTITGIVVYNE